MTRPSGARWSSQGRGSATQARLVTSSTELSVANSWMWMGENSSCGVMLRMQPRRHHAMCEGHFRAPHDTDWRSGGGGEAGSGCGSGCGRKESAAHDVLI